MMWLDMVGTVNNVQETTNGDPKSVEIYTDNLKLDIHVVWLRLDPECL